MKIYSRTKKATGEMDTEQLLALLKTDVRHLQCLRPPAPERAVEELQHLKLRYPASWRLYEVEKKKAKKYYEAWDSSRRKREYLAKEVERFKNLCSGSEQAPIQEEVIDRPISTTRSVHVAGSESSVYPTPRHWPSDTSCQAFEAKQSVNEGQNRPEQIPFISHINAPPNTPDNPSEVTVDTNNESADPGPSTSMNGTYLDILNELYPPYPPT